MSPVRYSEHIASAEYIERMVEGIAGAYGLDIATEGEVTPSLAFVVAVAAITANAYRINGAPVTSAYAGGTVTHAAADPTNPRLDIVYVDNTGAIGIVTGVAAAAPVPPAIGSANRMHLAQVRVPGGAGGIGASDITDKRQRLLPGQWEHIDTQVLATAAASISFTGISSAYRFFHLFAHIQNDATVKQFRVRLNNDAAGNYEATTDGVDSTGVAVNTVRNADTGFVVMGATLQDMAASESAVFSALFSKPAAAFEGLWRSDVVRLISATAPALVTLHASWENVADLINRVDLVADAGNFAADTRVSLFGLRVTS